MAWPTHGQHIANTCPIHHTGHETLRKQTETFSKIHIFNVELTSVGVAAGHALTSPKSGT